LKVPAFIGLGANLGDHDAQVRRAMQALGDLPRTRLLASSSLYRTAPVGVGEQPDFINAVAKVETELTARELLEELLTAEARFGRERRSRARRARSTSICSSMATRHTRTGTRRLPTRACTKARLRAHAARGNRPGYLHPRTGNVKTLLAACRGQKIQKIGET
jgi:2-amino-4-hydroxy-6-hydroxymethyldihydropteridine diphosphokinase